MLFEWNVILKYLIKIKWCFEIEKIKFNFLKCCTKTYYDNITTSNDYKSSNHT
jgi:hypothetical protein